MKRIERKYTQLAGAIMFAGGWWGVYATHTTAALVAFFVIATVGTTLWQFSMWVYIPGNASAAARSRSWLGRRRAFGSISASRPAALVTYRFGAVDQVCDPPASGCHMRRFWASGELVKDADQYP